MHPTDICGRISTKTALVQRKTFQNSVFFGFNQFVFLTPARCVSVLTDFVFFDTGNVYQCFFGLDWKVYGLLIGDSLFLPVYIDW